MWGGRGLFVFFGSSEKPRRLKKTHERFIFALRASVSRTMEMRGVPLAAAGAHVDSSEWHALCVIEAELEAELGDDVSRTSGGRKSAKDVTSWQSSETPTTGFATRSPSRTSSSYFNHATSSSPGYQLRRQPHPSWAPSASQFPAHKSSPGTDDARFSTHSVYSQELGVVLDGFGKPMLPLDLSTALVRPGRRPLRERETRTWAETTVGVVSDVSASVGKGNENRFEPEPKVDSSAGAFHFRGGFVDDAPLVTSKRPESVPVRRRSAPILRVEKLLSSTTSGRKKTRPPFVVGAGDSARARFSREAKENYSARVSAANGVQRSVVSARRSLPSTRELHGTRPEGLKFLSPNSASPGTRRRVERIDDDAPSDFRYGQKHFDANDAAYAAAVDATRSLFNAVEKRVRDAIGREMSLRVTTPTSQPYPFATPSERNVTSTIPVAAVFSPASDGTASVANPLVSPIDGTPDAAPIEPTSIPLPDGKKPVRAMKRSIDSYLERRRSGTGVSSAASTPTAKSNQKIKRLSPKTTMRKTDSTDSSSKQTPKTTRSDMIKPLSIVSMKKRTPVLPVFISESEENEFTYAPVYSPITAKEAHTARHSEKKDTKCPLQSTKNRAFLESVSPKISEDLRSRLRLASHLVSPPTVVSKDTKAVKKQSDEKSSSDSEEILKCPPRKTWWTVPESSSSDEDEEHELATFCTRYRTSRVTSGVLEQWMHETKFRTAPAWAHWKYTISSRAFYAWRAERLGRGIRNEVANRFYGISKLRHDRRLLLRYLESWLREVKRIRLFRDDSLVLDIEGGVEVSDPLSAVRSRLRPVGSNESVLSDFGTTNGIGTLSEFDDAYSGSPQSASPDTTAVRSVVAALVNETVSHDSRGPLDVTTPAVLVEELGLMSLEERVTGGINEMTETNALGEASDACEPLDTDSSNDSSKEEENEKPPAVVHSGTGFSPENAASIEAVTVDAADAVWVAVTGLLGLWRISENRETGGEELNAEVSNALYISDQGQLDNSRDERDDVLTTPSGDNTKRLSRFDPLNMDSQSDHETSPAGRQTPNSSSPAHRTPRVVKQNGQTMVLLDKGDGSPGNREVYVSMAEYLEYVDACAASYV